MRDRQRSAASRQDVVRSIREQRAAPRNPAVGNFPTGENRRWLHPRRAGGGFICKRVPIVRLRFDIQGVHSMAEGERLHGGEAGADRKNPCGGPPARDGPGGLPALRWNEHDLRKPHEDCALFQSGRTALPRTASNNQSLWWLGPHGGGEPLFRTPSVEKDSTTG